jgi:hypothetical protein
MKAIQIAWIGGPEVLESDYVRTREQLTPIMNAVFEMYLAKELEVLIGPAYALEDAWRLTEISRVASPPGNVYFLLGAEHEANENHDAYSKRTSEIRKDPTRNGVTALQP